MAHKAIQGLKKSARGCQLMSEIQPVHLDILMDNRKYHIKAEDGVVKIWSGKVFMQTKDIEKLDILANARSMKNGFYRIA